MLAALTADAPKQLITRHVIQPNTLAVTARLRLASLDATIVPAANVSKWSDELYG
jgi:hypothetical protein